MDLITRIENASGPDRELDAEIAATCRLGAEQWKWADGYPAWEGRADGRVYLEEGGPSFSSPAYTSSIDAALTLVPEGWTDVRQHHYRMTDDSIRAFAEIEFDLADMSLTSEGRAATPALALCAAALKARKEMEGCSGIM